MERLGQLHSIEGSELRMLSDIDGIDDTGGGLADTVP